MWPCCFWEEGKSDHQSLSWAESSRRREPRQKLYLRTAICNLLIQLCLKRETYPIKSFSTWRIPCRQAFHISLLRSSPTKIGSHVVLNNEPQKFKCRFQRAQRPAPINSSQPFDPSCHLDYYQIWPFSERREAQAFGGDSLVIIVIGI